MRTLNPFRMAIVLTLSISLHISAQPHTEGIHTKVPTPTPKKVRFQQKVVRVFYENNYDETLCATIIPGTPSARQDVFHNHRICIYRSQQDAAYTCVLENGRGQEICEARKLPWIEVRQQLCDQSQHPADQPCIWHQIQRLPLSITWKMGEYLLTDTHTVGTTQHHKNTARITALPFSMLLDLIYVPWRSGMKLGFFLAKEFHSLQIATGHLTNNPPVILVSAQEFSNFYALIKRKVSEEGKSR
ncbi:MAG: hypothetical protein OXT67_13490 [Zetaproteobacteria bacterium]|nr:hypothetical protein [Zetaproteobacteria bacterium]